MRTFTLLLFLLGCTNSYSETIQTDTIQKWTDKSGQIHYGDKPPATAPYRLEQLEIENNFDPIAYEQAITRHSKLEAEVKKIEARDRKSKNHAEKMLDDYFKDLDRKDSQLEKTRASKRKARESERNRTSIKIKRSKPSADMIGVPSYRGDYRPR